MNLLFGQNTAKGQALGGERRLGDLLKIERAASSAIWYIKSHGKNILGFNTGSLTKEGTEIIAKIGYLMQDTIKTEMSI